MFVGSNVVTVGKFQDFGKYQIESIISQWKANQVWDNFCKKKLNEDNSSSIHYPLIKVQSINNCGWRILNLKKSIVLRFTFPSYCLHIRDYFTQFSMRLLPNPRMRYHTSLILIIPWDQDRKFKKWQLKLPCSKLKYTRTNCYYLLWIELKEVLGVGRRLWSW